MRSGQDIHHLLDTCTLEQLEVLAQCAWQHELTKLGVYAYAVGGKPARERVPGSPTEELPPHDGPSIGWENAQGRWNLARKLPDGTIVPVYPSHTPEQAEAMKRRALSRLQGVQAAEAARSGKRAPALVRIEPPAVAAPKGGAVADAVAKMRAQLDGAHKPGGG